MKKLTKAKLIIVFISVLFFSCVDDYKTGMEYFDKKNYRMALVHFKYVEKSDKDYANAVEKIIEIDSIQHQIKIENQLMDSIAKVEAIKKEITNIKEQLVREIENIKTFDGNLYKYEIEVLKEEITLFSNWITLINKAKNSGDKENIYLANTLKSKVITLQKSEFPKMRNSYGSIVREKLWENNIEVHLKGTGFTIIEFEGGIFANNKNKQDTQETLSEILNLLRFKRVNYKWYKYDDEYTYYTLRSPNDGDLVEK